MTFANSPKTVRFLNANPTLLGTVAGFPLYEHPTLGDEAPMLTIVNGDLRRTSFYDLPSAAEMLAEVK